MKKQTKILHGLMVIICITGAPVLAMDGGAVPLLQLDGVETGGSIVMEEFPNDDQDARLLEVASFDEERLGHSDRSAKNCWSTLVCGFEEDKEEAKKCFTHVVCPLGFVGTCVLVIVIKSIIDLA